MRRRFGRGAAAVGALLTLLGCVGAEGDNAAVVPPPASEPPSAVEPTTAAEMALRRAAPLPPLDADRARAALAAFRLSCPALVRRRDLSGLTQAGDWDAPCAAADRVVPGGEAEFFARFTPVRVGTGALFATGYYEPELAGSRTRRAGTDTPLYAKPDDLIEVDLGQFSAAQAGKRVRGRIEGATLVPYYDRAAIEEGALAGRGLEIAWADDPIDVFFLQIQGSGRLRLPDGSVMRVGYAGQNGHDYTAIGRLLVQRGELASGTANLDAIVGWLRAHPVVGAALMRENASYVFFRELTGPGPLGALNLPVTPRVSVAADPRFVPLGAPVFLTSERAELSGLWVAQDTGGAIKGANRLDSFWGAGEEAKAIAGGLSAGGTAVLLLPEPAARRLLGE